MKGLFDARRAAHDSAAGPAAGSPAGPDAAVRLPLIDAARGVAVLAMIAYHFSWDLWAFALIDVDLLEDPFWLAARTLIASSFLFIAGVCAAPRRDAGPGRAGSGFNGSGCNGAEGLFTRAVLRRFIVLAAAAGAVSAATWVVFPQSWIFFGVLHHLAVAGLLAALIRRAAPPAWLLAASAVVVWTAGTTVKLDALNAAPLLWLGMGSVEPGSNDYVPLFPWFGAVLAGMAVGPRLSAFAAGRGAARGRVRGGLTRLGRHSLIVYLLHQPLLYGGVWAYVELAAYAGESAGMRGADTRAERDFMQSCAASCAAVGGLRCEADCLCARDGLRRADLWEPLLSNGLSPEQRAAVERIALSCAAPR